MARFFLQSAASIALFSSSVLADAPRVATDIPPVQGLVAQVMDGLGEPKMVMDPGASPHGYSMRPSEAVTLERSEVVFWIGSDLTPWLADAIETLASDATVVSLLDLEGTESHGFREEVFFGDADDAHDHGHEDDHDDEHADEHGDEHDDAHEDDHEDEHSAEHGHMDEHGHEHGSVDPHAWLDPSNARLWLNAIAETLANADPDNADAYRANAQAGVAAIDVADAAAAAKLESVRDRPFVVFHDAYQYFETHYDLTTLGAISLGDASDPGPARVAAIRDVAAEAKVTCAFAEPQFKPDLVNTIFEGTATRTEVLDPLGTELDVGPTLYPALITDLADRIAGCLSD